MNGFLADLQAMAGCERPWQLLTQSALKAFRPRPDSVTHRLEAFGRYIQIDVETGGSELLAAILDRLPRFPRSRSTAPTDRMYEVARLPRDGAARSDGSPSSPAAPAWRYRLTVNRLPLPAVRTIDEAAEQVAVDLQNFLVLSAPGVTFIHAGVVGLRGRALLLPGASGAGKSTLVAALLNYRARYASDEFAVLGADGLVRPYPRPLVLKQEHRHRQIDLRDDKARTVRAPLPAGLVLFTEYARDGAFSPQRLSPGDAVLRLLRHCPGAQSRSAETLAMLRALADSTPVWVTPRGDADQTARALAAADWQRW